MSVLHNMAASILLTSMAAADSTTEVGQGDEGPIISYVNITFQKGTSLNAIPLVVDKSFPGAIRGSFPKGAELVFLRNGALLTNRNVGFWEETVTSLMPYEAFQLAIPNSTVVTISGQVPNMANPAILDIPKGESWIGLPVPSKELTLDSLHFPAVEGVVISVLNGDGSRSTRAQYTNSRWNPAPPKFRIAEAVIIQSPQPIYWSVAYAGGRLVSLKPGPARIRELPARLIAGSDETVILNPVVDGPRPITLEWSHEGTGVIPVNGYSIRLPTQGKRKDGKFTLRVTDADGNSDTAGVLVERYDGLLKADCMRDGDDRYLVIYGRSSQAAKVFYSVDCKIWTEWNEEGGLFDLPARLDTKIPRGEAKHMFFKVVTQ